MAAIREIPDGADIPLPPSQAEVGKKARAAFDSMWDDAPPEAPVTPVSDGGGDTGGEEPAASPVVVKDAAPVKPVAEPPKAKDPFGDLPAELIDRGTTSKTPAAPDPLADAEDEARAQQTLQALPEKAQREAFINLRRELKEEKQRRKDIESKIAQAQQELEQTRTQTGQATAEALAQVTKELEATKAKLVETEGEIGKTNYEKSREFQERYVLPSQAVLTKMEKLLTTAGGHSKEEAVSILRAFLQAPANQRAEALGEEPVAIQGALLSAVADYDDLSENAQIALQNWRDRKAAVTEEQRRIEKAGFVKNLFADTDKAVEALVAEGNVLYTKTGDSEWNKKVDERIASIRGVLSGSDPSTVIKYVADGVTSSQWRDMYFGLAKSYKELKAQAEGIVRARAPVGGDASVGQLAAKPKPKTSQDALDSIFGPAAA